ncbi:MAG: acyl-CoA synthetase [Chitinophagaceae bacterium]|nr:acyl-CoA synthetase [Chitinophagaceae bacterium]
MLKISFTSSSPDLTDLQNDENLRPAVALINNWNTGADSFTFFSSGSTGSPKPIVLSKAFLVASANRTIQLFNINSSDRLLLALNTSFMGGMMMIVRALVAQCELIYISPADLNVSSLNALPSIKLASLVPSQVHGLLEKATTDPFSKIENLLLGGAPISQSLERSLINLKSSCCFFHTYGMTETASHVAIRALNNQSTPYHALEGFEFSIDERECLVIRYIDIPEFTLYTNDVVELLSPKSFQWLGRIDWVVNSGGIKYNLEIVEECIVNFLRNNHLDNHFTSYKTQDETWGEKWVLILTGSLQQEHINLLKAHCKNTLGKYIYPKEILFTKKIVYLPSGKVDRLTSYHQAIKPLI